MNRREFLMTCAASILMPIPSTPKWNMHPIQKAFMEAPYTPLSLYGIPYHADVSIYPNSYMGLGREWDPIPKGQPIVNDIINLMQILEKGEPDKNE